MGKVRLLTMYVVEARKVPLPEECDLRIIAEFKNASTHELEILRLSVLSVYYHKGMEVWLSTTW